MITQALAQTLPSVVPAAASTGFAVNWLYVAAGVAVLLIGLCVWLFIRYRKRNPEGAARVQASATADFEAFGHAIAAAVDRAVDRGLAARAGAVGSPVAGATQAQATPAPTEALPVKGKSGQPGMFTVTVPVNGDPRADIPAINAAVTAAYFG